MVVTNLKAEIFNKQLWLPNQGKEVTKPLFDKLLIDSGFTILNYVEHVFDNGAYTSLWLLAQSHLAIHTFPEEEKLYLELSSCDSELSRLFEKEMCENALI